MDMNEKERSGRTSPQRRLSMDDIVAHMAWHDDNHLDQLKRALEGRA
jgi:hypothetical protein